jgi:purine-binding chemotaxis protein CheW
MPESKTKLEAFDWQKVRERLARASKALEEGLKPSPERIRAVLEERARAAARIPAPPPEAGAVLEVVLFDLGNERCAIETAFVREIHRPKEIAPLPGTPDFVVGISNLRGEMLAIFDLQRFFDMAATAPTEHSRVIVFGQERVEFGIRADRVHEVALLRIADIQEPPASVAAGARAFLRGVTADALLVLSGTALLDDPRLLVDLGEP